MKLWIILAGLAIGFSAHAQTTKPSASTKPVKGQAVPTPEQIMAQMLPPTHTPDGRPLIQPLPDPPKTDPATGKIIPPNPPQLPLKREGSFVNNAACRMQKTADGQAFELTFDTDGKDMVEAPMNIIPNQKLASMELLIQGLNRDPKFHITGMVTEYKGKNYILIENATLDAEVTQQF